jgi:hypothetical protein
MLRRQRVRPRDGHARSQVSLHQSMSFHQPTLHPVDLAVKRRVLCPGCYLLPLSAQQMRRPALHRQLLIQTEGAPTAQRQLSHLAALAQRARPAVAAGCW